MARASRAAAVPFRTAAPRRRPTQRPARSGRSITATSANDFAEAGERYRSFEEREREELIANLVGALSGCDPVIQQKMLRHLALADRD